MTKIKVSQETVDYLQRLHYEVDSRADIIQRIIEAHAADEDDSVIRSVPFRKYQEELAELKAEYELAKQEAGNQYIPEEVKGPNVNWSLDFQTGIMTIG